MAVPTDNNLSVKKYIKISKYRVLKTESEKSKWHRRTNIVSIVDGTLYMIKKGTEAYE